MSPLDLTLTLYGAALTAALVSTNVVYVQREEGPLSSILAAMIITGVCVCLFCASVVGAQLVRIVSGW